MLRIIIATQLILAFAALVLQVNICHPIRACWEPVEDFTCLPARFTIIWGYCHTVMGILADLVLSAMPIPFIVKIHITPARRILICLLMGTGLLTTTTAIIKTIYISRYITGDDPLLDTYFLSFWSHLEEVIGIIAACMPCIKAQVEALLRRFDITWLTSSVMSTLHTHKSKSTHQEVDILVPGGMDGKDGFKNQDTILMEDWADRKGHSRTGERSLTEQRSFSESGTAPCEGWTTV
ncbi:hypothetical protein EDB81DRAFT_32422 [Dactylonectria macrodidyma]|uniref:Rhodopsin domain-containing protein n=1 Tax=Dactylonectria macrodidyma TaxID=307937 RepID=A0A9P9JNH3_9HYPO|nr:hypothetical protein EDB81DRAFT_32422 [Dactylonectria macrodidyma]